MPASNPRTSAAGIASAQLRRLIQEVRPGATVLRSRRLRGGIGSTMNLYDLVLADGSRTRVVLRRYQDRGNPQRAGQLAGHEFAVLRFLQRRSFAAPAPLWLDAAGDRLGVPSMLLSYVPGQPIIFPKALRPWLMQLAETAASIHSLAPDPAAERELPGETKEALARRITKCEARVGTMGDPLTTAVFERLRENVAGLILLAPELTHGDFWPGNVIWHRGRVAGVIDWTSAALGDPRKDIGQARSEVAIAGGLQAADEFQNHYERIAGSSLRDMWFFDLLHSLDFLLEYREWIAAYHDSGFPDVTAESVRQQLEPFIERALEGARSAG